MKENEKFQQSLEARLNKLKNAATEFSLAIGDAFLKEGLIAGMSLLASAAKGAAAFVDAVGILPPVIGNCNCCSIIFNSSLRATAMKDGALFIRFFKTLPAIIAGTDTALAARALKMRLYAMPQILHLLALKGLKRAAVTTLTFLAGAFLPIAAFMAIGFAIEKITVIYSKSS